VLGNISDDCANGRVRTSNAKNHCCGDGDEGYVPVNVHVSSGAQGAAGESTAKGVEAGGSHALKRNRPSTCVPQKLRGKAQLLVQWARQVLVQIDHLDQESRDNCYDYACTR